MLRPLSAHLRKQSKDSTSNAITLDSVFGAASKVWAAIDVWGIWRLYQQQQDQNILMWLQCVKGRTCADGTAWNVEGSNEEYSFLLTGSRMKWTLLQSNEASCGQSAGDDLRQWPLLDGQGDQKRTWLC